jgi:transposase
MARTFTEGELADMAGSLAAGATLAEVGKRYGCAPSRVREKLLDAGLYQPRRSSLSETERAMVEDYVRQGFSVPAIAEHLGRKDRTVSSLIRKEGWHYEPRKGGGHRREPRITNGRTHRVDADTVRRIVSAARRNHTLTAAAAAAGVDVKTLERVLSEEAPVVGNRLKRSYPVPVEVIDNYAGDLAQVPETIRHYGLVSDSDYENVAADHGPEYVESLIDRLGADRAAAAQMIAKLRRGLERHRARAAREGQLRA